MHEPDLNTAQRMRPKKLQERAIRCGFHAPVWACGRPKRTSMQITTSAQTLIGPLLCALALAAAAGCETKPNAQAAAPSSSAPASQALPNAITSAAGPDLDVEVGEVATVMNPSVEGNADAFWRSVTPRGLRLSGEGPEQIACRAKGSKRVGALELRLFVPPSRVDISTILFGGVIFAGKQQRIYAKREGERLVVHLAGDKMPGEKLARIDLTGKRTIHIFFTGEVLTCE
jgi:hypothetical protein